MARMSVGECLTNIVWAKLSSFEDIKCSGNWMWAAKLPGEGALLYDAAVALSNILTDLGIAIDGIEKAYPFKELRKHGMETFSDSIGDTELTIEWQEKEKYARAIDRSGKEIPTVIVYWFAWYAFHPDTEIFAN